MSTKYEAYVDGSFMNNAIGYGSVILQNDQKIDELSGQVDPCYLEHRQVAGELEATVMTLEWCKENNVNEIAIHYDYKGIECWATGQWRAKKDLTKTYVRYIKNCNVKIKWVKVDAHTGVKWNEYADKLAKSGVQATAKSKSNSKNKNNSVKQPGDLVKELQDKTLIFVEILLSYNINAVFDKIINNMFARIEIYQNSERVGILDIYNTAKKPFSPDFRAFKNSQLQSEINSYWKDFINS